MRYTSRATIDASAAAVWDVLCDVRRWPSWTPTVESVHTESFDGTLVVGQSVTVKQPRRRLSRYVLQEVTVGSSFSWGSARFGVRQLAAHEIEPKGPHSCNVRLTFEFSGWLGSALGVLGARRIKDMVDTEAQSLKARLEDSSTIPK